VHRTFLEYLAADEAIQQHHVNTLIAHSHLDTWWETVVMACGHATTMQASQLLTGILDRAQKERTKARRLRLLAAACLETVRDIAPAVSARVDAMVRQNLAPPRSLNETGTLMAIGPRILRYLPDSLEGLSTAKAQAAVRAAALAGTADALPLLAAYAQDPRAVVHEELEMAWRYFDPERYAEVVLANSPLDNGRLTVLSRRHLPYVRGLSALTMLNVDLQHESVEGLDLFTELPALNRLSVNLRPSTTYDFRLLSEHRHLRWLFLGGLQAPADLSPLADLPALDSVTLEGYWDESLSGSAELDTVSHLQLFGSEDSGSMEHAARVFRSITFLNVSRCEPLDLESIARMASIEELMLQNSQFDSIAPLAQMARLRLLDIANNVRFDYDVSPLAALSLRSVSLDAQKTYIGVEALRCAVSPRSRVRSRRRRP
jgi:hypothetical protein